MHTMVLVKKKKTCQNGDFKKAQVLVCSCELEIWRKTKKQKNTLLIFNFSIIIMKRFLRSPLLYAVE